MLAERDGKLIRAGGGAHAALDALQAGDGFFYSHADDERSHALRVAGAAALKAAGSYNTVLDFEIDGTAAYAVGLVGVHEYILLVMAPACCVSGETNMTQLIFDAEA